MRHHWDGDMRDKTNRTLIGWAIASGRFHGRPQKREPWMARVSEPTPRQRRRFAADRARSLAEMVEGVSSHHDQQRYGMGPFGRFTLGSWRRG